MKEEIIEFPKGKYIMFEPGNATKYEVYIVPEHYSGNVVVSLPEFNTSFYINPDASLTWGYVFEKMSRSGRRANECDASAITGLLSRVLGVPAKVHTGDDGRWIEEERWVGEHGIQDPV